MEFINNSLLGQGEKMKKIYSYFCWCSGARLYLLKQCPTEFNKYFGIGAIVFFTGVLASLTGGYALYTVFENFYLACLFGLFWGMLIFFLDWYIVSSLRKENRFRKEFFTALPRLILAIFLAIIISKPLELRLFQNEILKEIEVLKRDNELNYQSKVFDEFDEIGKLEEDNKQMNKSLREKEEQRMQLFNLLVEEAEGRSPTGVIGKGPVYKEKKIEYNNISKELENLNKVYNNQIHLNQQRINLLKAERDKKINVGFKASENYSGFLARLEALGSLTARNKYINVANIFLVILFILLESSPVLVKLMSKRGPYDVLLDSEEITKTFKTENEIVRLNTLLDEESENKRKKKRLKNEARTKVLDHFYQKLTEAGKEINQIKINRWKEKESKKINENFDDESGKISSTLNSH